MRKKEGGGESKRRKRREWEGGGKNDVPSWQVSDQAEAVGQGPDGFGPHRGPLVTQMVHLQGGEWPNSGTPILRRLSASMFICQN